MEPDLLTSYLTNILRLSDESYETITELRPVSRRARHEATLGPLYIVPVWNPEGHPTSVGENIFWREAAEFHALGAAGWFTIGAAHAADLSWAEETLAVALVNDDEAIALAREVRQPACWHWTGEELRVLSSKDGRQLGATPATARRLTHRPCPMRPGDLTTRERCERPGGPWTSRSMEVAAYFERDRTALVSALGCDVCEGGAVGGAAVRPILLHEWSAASRLGAPRILHPIEVDD